MIEPPDMNELLPLLQRARDEDLGPGDITSEGTIPADLAARGRIVAREGCVVCGLVLLGPLAGLYGDKLEVLLSAKDGHSAGAGAELAAFAGPARAMLAFERAALNFLQRLSGIATTTRAYVEAVAGTRAEILDTRKTTPGLRLLEKYAVRCGGGTNHRVGLFDAVLVKDNHVALAGLEDLPALVRDLRRRHPRKLIEIEVDTLDQLHNLLTRAGDAVDVVLLDNMTAAQMAEAVRLRDELARRPDADGPARPGRPLLEASGGITLSTVRAAAESGVDRISVGALTHSARAVDISMEIEAAT